MCRFEEQTSIRITFVVGHSADKALEFAMDQEAQAYGGFMRLNLEVCILGLSLKALQNHHGCE